MKISWRGLVMTSVLACAVGLSPVMSEPPTEPPYDGTAFLNPNVITNEDPTAFETLTYIGKRTRFMYDRRTDRFDDTSAYLFVASYRDGLTIEMQVNSEFGSREAAEVEAKKYAEYIGKLPTLLRVSAETAWIHRGDADFGGGNRNFLIHTDRGRVMERANYRPGGVGNYVEEVLLHEGTHTSLDETHAEARGWRAAQSDDPTFISTYARDHPAREDLAESFVPYMIVRYRADRTTKSMVDTINAAIPSRIAYLDAELAASSWCPVVPEDCDSDKASTEASGDREVRAAGSEVGGDWIELQRFSAAVLRHFQSTESSVKTSITFVNDTGADISIHWVDYRGRRVDRGVVSAGASVTHATHVGNLWAVKDANGEIIAVFRTERSSGRALVSVEAE